MLNKVIACGRITAPLELRHTGTGTPVCAFTIAVEREFKGQNGERLTDFLPVVTWSKTAEFVSKYFDKGRLICVEGNLQSRKYTDKEGKNRVVIEIIASNVYFTGEKAQTNTTANNEPTEQSNDDEFEDLSGILDDDDLPF